MIWAKKKKMIIIYSSIALLLAVPQFASIPFYTKILSSETINVNGAFRISDPELLSGAQSSSRIDSSNKDQNLNSKPVQKQPILTPEPPKVVEENPKPIKPVLEEPKEPPVISVVPIAPEPIAPNIPVEPVAPVVPIVPVAPVTPVEPVVPDEPIIVQPATPVKPVVTDEPIIVQPVTPVKPVDPIPQPPKTGGFTPGADEEIVSTSLTIKIPVIDFVPIDPYNYSTPDPKPIHIPVRVIVKKPEPRHKFPESDKEIQNRIPYTTNVAPEIINIELTEEYVNALRTSFLAILKFDIEAGVGRQKLENGTIIDWKNRTGIPKEQIDWNNIKLSEESLEKLRKGNTLNSSGLYLNEKGEVDSTSWGPINDRFNGTTSLYARDNAEFRTFGYKEYYPRTSGAVYNGDFPGWTKRNVKNEWLKFGLDNNDGIEVLQYTNDDPAFAKNNNAIRVVLDASNEAGYRKYIQFLQNVKKDPSKKITSFVIKNMGVSGVNQKFINILEALPDKVPNLELWLEQPNNTAFLYALRPKKIDELTLITTGNSLLQSWSINPLSVQNTAFITWQDYNVSSSYQEGYKPATRVNISTFAFDPDNYKPGEADPYREINLGLRMAYYVRNNERFFQGEHGRGVENPDNSERTNTVWPNLDLSRIPQIKSLKGLKFDFGEGNNKFSRQVVRLTLYNDSPIFTISTDELNNSQFHKVMHMTGMGIPSDRLKFSGQSVRNMRIVGNDVRLTAEGLRNLETFYREIGKDVFGSRAIYVDPNDSTVRQTLENNGYTTGVYTKDLEITFN